MEELKTFDMTNPDEVRAFIRECFSEIPEHPVHTETEESYREHQKDLRQHEMYNDRVWNRSGLGEF